MSFRTVEAVLERSRSRGSARMVLVVIAECANHDGSEAWPAVETIAHRAGISRASVFRQIKALTELGELEVESKGGRSGCNRYRVTVQEASEEGSQVETVSDRDSLSSETGPSHSRSETVSRVRPEPSGTTQEPTPSPLTEEQQEMAEDFAGWLSHHWATTQMNPPREGTKARAHIEAMYRARRGEGLEDEGYTARELEWAIEGAFADEHRRQHGYYDHESVLRPLKIHKLVEAGRRLRQPAPNLHVLRPDRTDERLAEAQR